MAFKKFQGIVLTQFECQKNNGREKQIFCNFHKKIFFQFLKMKSAVNTIPRLIIFFFFQSSFLKSLDFNA